MALRRALNLIAGANVTVTPVDNTATGQQDVTIAAAGGGGTTVVVSEAHNAANVGIAAAATVVATKVVTVTATQTVEVDAIATFLNISEALGVGANLTLEIQLDGAASSPVWLNNYASGDPSQMMAAKNLLSGLAAGNHTLTLVATSDAGAGNTRIPATLGRMSVRIYGT